MPPKDEEKLDFGVTEEPTVTVDLNETDDETGGQETRGDEEPAAPRQRDAQGKWSKEKAARGGQNRERVDFKKYSADTDRRFKEMQDANRREVDALRAELARNAERARPAGAPVDPFEAKFADLDAQLQAELSLIEKDPTRNYTRYNQLRRQETQLVTQQAMQQAQQGQRPQQQQAPRGQYDARREILAGEFPWMNDPNARALNDKAYAIRQYLINVEGYQDTIEVDRMALSQAIAKFGGDFGFRQPAPPSQRTRQMYAGPGAGAGPTRGVPRQETEVELPAGLARASGLTPEKLRAALRGDQG
jgi:hypothetical protein